MELVIITDDTDHHDDNAADAGEELAAGVEIADLLIGQPGDTAADLIVNEETMKILRLEEWVEISLLKSTSARKSPWQTAIEEFFATVQEIPTEDERREITLRLRNNIREVRGAFQGARLIHDIVPDSNSERSKALLRRSVGRKYKGGLFWVGMSWKSHPYHPRFVFRA